MAIPRDKLRRYRATLQRREAEEDLEQTRRRRRAWETARQAAEVLRQSYGVTRVWLFGSLATEARLSTHSDVDLAVCAMAPETYYRAVAQLQACSPEFDVDLVLLDQCPPGLHEAILREGIEL